MFVRRSTYDAKVKELSDYKEKHKAKLKSVKSDRDYFKGRHAVEQRDCLKFRKMAEDYMVWYKALRDKPTEAQFNQKQIKQMISLCHPDKHGNREIAKEITQLLLDIRKR